MSDPALRDRLARLLCNAFYAKDIRSDKGHPPWPPGWHSVADALLASEEWEATEGW